MNFDDSTRLSVTPAQLFEVLIHRMHELVPMLPNVVSTKRISVEEQGPGVLLVVRHWQGSAKQVPKLLRPFISQKSLAWTDYSIWDSNDYTCAWRIENIHSSYQTCFGKNLFTADPANPDGSYARLVGEFTVHGDRIPKVPRFLGRKIAPRAEKTVVGHSIENFSEMVLGAARLVAG
ncbi:MAG: hypothetical protein ACI9MR_003877 [Myxococcota bacterium]|jgi:hypothetical protein